MAAAGNCILARGNKTELLLKEEKNRWWIAAFSSRRQIAEWGKNHLLKTFHFDRTKIM